MEMSIWIAKLLGPVMLLACVPMLATPERVNAMAEDFLKIRPLMFITGILAFLAGLAMVNTHNVWVADWPVLITLFGWIMLAAGAARVLLPDAVAGLGGAMIARPIVTRAAGVIWAVLAAFLTYEGYA